MTPIRGMPIVADGKNPAAAPSFRGPAVLLGEELIETLVSVGLAGIPVTEYDALPAPVDSFRVGLSRIGLESRFMIRSVTAATPYLSATASYSTQLAQPEGSLRRERITDAGFGAGANVQVFGVATVSLGFAVVPLRTTANLIPEMRYLGGLLSLGILFQ